MSIRAKSDHIFNLLKSSLLDQGNNAQRPQPVTPSVLAEIAHRLYHQLSQRFDKRFGGFRFVVAAGLRLRRSAGAVRLRTTGCRYARSSEFRLR